MTPFQRTALAINWIDAVARFFVVGVLTWCVLDTIKDRYGPWISYGFGAAIMVIVGITLILTDDEVQS